MMITNTISYFLVIIAARLQGKKYNYGEPLAIVSFSDLREANERLLQDLED